MIPEQHPRIYLSSPHMGGSEIKNVLEAFETNWIAPVGPFLKQFEDKLCQYTGRRNAVALSSGTAAIHLALKIIGIGIGDKVLCQSFTFCGTSNPILYEEADPIFIDSESETWNMDPELLEKAIKAQIANSQKPKAIIYVHLYGMPAKIDEILSIADHYQIPVIEDAAEALGSAYNNKPIGMNGDFSVFSFNGNKIITTSGGGTLLSDRSDWIDNARFLSTQARDNAPHYEHTEIGYNYRMSNIAAGIGSGQMEVLDKWVIKRRENFEFYRKELGGIDGINFLNEPEGTYSNRWLTCIEIDAERTAGMTREDLRSALEAENIESRPLWKPMHMQPVYSGAQFYSNGVSEKLFTNGLCLPSGSNLKHEDLERVVKVIKKLFS